MTELEKEYVDKLVNEYRKRIVDFVEKNQVVEETLDVMFDNYANSIADFFCIDVDKMLGKLTRKREYVIGRRFLFWFCRQKFGNKTSLAQLGELAGGFDHTTVLYQVKKFNEDYDYDCLFKQDADALLNRFGYKILKVKKERYTIQDGYLQL